MIKYMSHDLIKTTVKIFTKEEYIVDYEYELVHIKTIDGSHCLTLAISDEIHIEELDKCNSRGNVLLGLVEKLAKKLKINKITLFDGSKIKTDCPNISINLSTFRILTTGISWYNAHGYYSNTFREEEEHNEKIQRMPFIESIKLAIKCKQIIDSSRFSNEFSHEILFSEIEEQTLILDECTKYISNVQLNTKQYLTELYELMDSRFNNSNSEICKLFKLMDKILLYLQCLIKYNSFLEKLLL